MSILDEFGGGNRVFGPATRKQSAPEKRSKGWRHSLAIVRGLQTRRNPRRKPRRVKP
jgi:hypothetical protein